MSEREMRTDERNGADDDDGVINTAVTKREPDSVQVSWTSKDFASQQVELAKAMRAVALAITTPQDWVDLDGKPYLTEVGCRTFQARLGISVTILDRQEYHREDEKGPYIEFEFTVLARLRHPVLGTQIEAEQIGNCTTRDPFFAKRQDTILPLSEVDVASVKKAALTNARARAIKSVIGYAPTWAELEAHFGPKMREMATVKYGGKSEAKSVGKGEFSQDKKKIADMLLEMSQGATDVAAQWHMKIAGFKGKDGKWVDGPKSPRDLSDKWAARVLHDVKDAHEEWTKTGQVPAKLLGEGGGA